MLRPMYIFPLFDNTPCSKLGSLGYAPNNPQNLFAQNNKIYFSLTLNDPCMLAWGSAQLCPPGPLADKGYAMLHL